MNPSSKPAPSGSAPAFGTPPKESGGSLLRGSVPRFVGYGLLVLFALDVAQTLVGYKPFSPDSDMSLVVQLVERVGVLLVAYALIFGSNTSVVAKGERHMLKLLSWGAFVAMICYLGLGVLAVASAYRLVARGSYNIERQSIERVNALENSQKKIPTASGEQLYSIYRSFNQIKPDDPAPERQALEDFVSKKIPEVVKSTRESADLAHSALVKQEIVLGSKYALGGLISALLFFLIWENTTTARHHRIFAQKNAPGMMLEDRLAGGFQTLQSRMEDAFFLSNLEKYRWYRKLRRFFGGRR